MKATIEIPDELYRQVKAKSALEGRAVREVTEELYRAYVFGENKPHATKEKTRENLESSKKPIPPWFGMLRKEAAKTQADDLESIRKSIAAGLARERQL